MSPKIILSCFALVTALAALSAVAINQRARPLPAEVDQKVFHATGIVRELSKDRKTIRVQHDEIPGYMPAMVMSLPFRSAGAAETLRSGDPIRFDLVVTKDDSWVEKIDRLSGPRVPASSDGITAAVLDAERVNQGEKVPDFRLLDQDGQEFQLGSFRGKAVLVTFIYTRCPLPNFCPLMSKNFAELQKRLAKDIPGKFQLLSISIDPDFDRPEILKAYAARYTQNSENWTFATGPQEEIDTVTSLFGLTRKAEGGLIAHNLATALIAPDGRLVHIWKSNVWTPYEVQRRIHETLGLPST